MKALFFILSLVFYVTAEAQEYHAANEATFSFKIRNAGITVDGEFSQASVRLNFSPSNLPASFVSISVPVSTLHTGINARDNHLKGKDYFNLADFPFMTFKSTSFKQTGNDKYLVNGILSIKGTEKQKSIAFTVSQREGYAIYEGQFQINRLDYNVGKSSWVLSDDVLILFSLNSTNSK